MPSGRASSLQQKQEPCAEGDSFRKWARKNKHNLAQFSSIVQLGLHTIDEYDDELCGRVQDYWKEKAEEDENREQAMLVGKLEPKPKKPPGRTSSGKGLSRRPPNISPMVKRVATVFSEWHLVSLQVRRAIGIKKPFFPVLASLHDVVMDYILRPPEPETLDRLFRDMLQEHRVRFHAFTYGDPAAITSADLSNFNVATSVGGRYATLLDFCKSLSNQGESASTNVIFVYAADLEDLEDNKGNRVEIPELEPPADETHLGTKWFSLDESDSDV